MIARHSSQALPTMPTSPTQRVHLLHPPYHNLTPIADEAVGWNTISVQPGSALVWRIRKTAEGVAGRIASGRPGGVPLIVVLPPAPELIASPSTWAVVGRCRPQSVLPFHDDLAIRDLSRLLRRPPEDLGAAITDYLAWRGIPLDADTIRIVRRMIELSSDLSSVTSLARCLYMSRRQLGRRFSSRGLPVPSHWLQLGRQIRLVIALQNSKKNLTSVACSLGFTDGYTASSQMYRLLGLRPTSVRSRLGWEWVVEHWLRREAESGGLVPDTEFGSYGGTKQGESYRRELTKANTP